MVDDTVYRICESRNYKAIMKIGQKITVIQRKNIYVNILDVW